MLDKIMYGQRPMDDATLIAYQSVDCSSSSSGTYSSLDNGSSLPAKYNGIIIITTETIIMSM